MKQNLVSIPLLIGLLSFVIPASYANPFTPSYTDTAFYYNEKGDVIGMDLDAKEKMSYVIKTKRTSGNIYGGMEQQSSDYEPADVNSISRKDYNKVEKLIRSGKTDHEFVRNNVVRILNKETFRLIRNNIKDDGKGDVTAANNKEYGGFINKKGLLADTTSGDVVDPCTLHGAHIALAGFGRYEYHSHPSGSRKNATPQDITEKVTMTGSRTQFGDKSETFYFIQGPSKTDQESIRKGNWGYVFGMEDKRIYVYNHNGVVATLSFKAFER